tara:strand:- start:172 stop:369 length:198 start_codon:yes stop_codon:yes gene_type:complete
LVAVAVVVKVKLVDQVVLEEVDLMVKTVRLELLDKVILVVTQVALLAVEAVEEKVVLEAQQQVKH